MGWVRSDDADELRGVHPLKMPQTCAELCPSESSASSAFNGSSCCDWKQRHLHVLTPWLYLCNMTTFRHHNGELVDQLSTAKSQHDVHRISQVRSSLLRTFGRRQGPINRCPACVGPNGSPRLMRAYRFWKVQCRCYHMDTHRDGIPTL